MRYEKAINKLSFEYTAEYTSDARRAAIAAELSSLEQASAWEKIGEAAEAIKLAASRFRGDK